MLTDLHGNIITLFYCKKVKYLCSYIACFTALSNPQDYLKRCTYCSLADRIQFRLLWENYAHVTLDWRCNRKQILVSFVSMCSLQHQQGNCATNLSL